MNLTEFFCSFHTNNTVTSLSVFTLVCVKSFVFFIFLIVFSLAYASFILFLIIIIFFLLNIPVLFTVQNSYAIFFMLVCIKNPVETWTELLLFSLIFQHFFLYRWKKWDEPMKINRFRWSTLKDKIISMIAGNNKYIISQKEPLRILNKFKLQLTAANYSNLHISTLTNFNLSFDFFFQVSDIKNKLWMPFNDYAKIV